MKTIKLLLTISILSCASVSAFALNGPGSYTVNGPTHLLNANPHGTRILADSVYGRCTVYEGHVDPEAHNYGNSFQDYGHNPNGLIDTLISSGGGGIAVGYILRYSDKGLLLSESDYVPAWCLGDSSYCSEAKEWPSYEYTYTDDGRLLSETKYKFNSNEVDTTINFSYIETDSGYISNYFYDIPVEYVLDEKGRVTHIKFPNNPEKYVTDSLGNRYRLDDYYYVYREDGFTEYRFFPTESGKATDFHALEYHFQKYDYPSQYTDYSIIDSVKKVKEHVDFTYGYKADNPLSIAPIAASSKVYAAGGNITIEAEKAATVSVYTFGGQMLKQQTVAAGTTQIPMAKGLYIVTVNGEGYKVLVN